jgi:phage terminase small subunit
MPAGVPTPEDVRAKFRAEYLISGNASASAKKVGISDRTGRELANVFAEEPEFAEERRRLRAGYLAELESMRMKAARLALKRARKKSGDEYSFGDGGTVIDKRPEYLKIVLDAEKNAHALAKVEQPSDGSQKTEVHVHLKGPGADGDSKPTD